ncbi:DUF2987 domain-containing protein [Pseudoalteromonas fenneropenaei]|uniref:DUF2987 domain-containing protein n=1 Tax=Pseudoalteromonas fenneropenaei TaxID=1737459 RepID=A0ABV7CF75_9GAMM
MNKVVKVLSALAIATLANAAMAKEFVVSYDGFYDRLKVVEKGQFEYARVNFYLVDIATMAPCVIASGKLVTENYSLPLTYTANAQLLLPYDKQLDTDKAVIVVEPSDPAHDCQLKMQIEADNISADKLNTQTLAQLNTEFDTLLTDLSGFFVGKLLAFMLPSQQGVQVEFSEPVNLPLPGVNCADKVCQFKIDDAWQSVKLPLIQTEVKKVTPWIVK